MAKINYSQTDFTAGELSPRLYSRSNIEGYQSGLRKCVNFIPYSQGPIARRKGTKFLRTFNGTYGRVFAFQLTSESVLGEAFPVVITDDGNMEVVGATGFVAGENLTANSSFDDGLTSWPLIDSATDATVSAGGGVLSIKASTTDGVLDGVVQEITIDPSDFNQDLDIDVNVQSPRSVGFQIFPELRIKVGTTSGGGELYDSTTTTGTFNVGTNATIYVSVVAEGGDYSSVSFPGEPTLNGTDTRNIYDVELRSPPVAVGELIFNIGWNEDDIRNAKAYMPPDGDIMYILTPNKQPRKIQYDESTSEWQSDVVSFSGRPDEWVDGSWPSCMTFYQGRAWWAGVRNEPNKIWSSVSAFNLSDYERINVGPNADDSVVVKLNRRGLIRWVEGGETLLVGTAYGEFAISSSGGIIIPEDIAVQQQSAYGASFVRTISLGTGVIYVSSDGRKLRNATYEWTQQKWTSRDLTFVSEHLTENSPIVDMTYSKNPESILWFVLLDGTVLTSTFESFTNVVGWSKHAVDGQILGMDTIEIDGESVIYLMIKKDGTLSLQQILDEVYLDSSVVYESPASSTLNGLDHLEGQEVSLLLDGAYAGTQIVTSGSVTASYTPNNAAVGIPYTSEMEPLSLEGTAPNGSSIPMSTRNIRFQLRVVNSSIPLVNGERPPVRTAATPMDTAQPLYSGIIDVTASSGYSEDGRYTISEFYPYPCTISGIYNQVEQSQL